MSTMPLRKQLPRKCKPMSEPQLQPGHYLKYTPSNTHHIIIETERKNEVLKNTVKTLQNEVKKLYQRTVQLESKHQKGRIGPNEKKLYQQYQQYESTIKTLQERYEKLEIYHKSMVKEKDSKLEELQRTVESLTIKEREAHIKRHSELEAHHKSDENEKLKQELMQKDEELKQKDKDLTQKDVQLKQKDQELTQLKQYNEQLRQKDEELKQKDKDLTQKDEQLKQKDKDLTERDVQLKQKDEEIKQKNKQLMEKDEQLKQNNDQLKQRCEQLTAINESQRSQVEQLNHQLVQHKESLLQKDKEITIFNEKLLAVEEDSYKYTNAFTSADDNSVLGISKRYRHVQHNMRASAVRASRSVYKIPPKRHFCDQIMAAYDTATEILMEESSKYINKFLLTLQPKGDTWNQENIKTCMKIVNQTLTDSKISEDAIEKIYKKLQWCDTEQRKDDTKADPISKDVSEYYQHLAELTWQAVARPIPMVYGVEENVYCKDVHELKDGYSDDEGKEITYIYPVLYTSNQWPRQIAKEGRVELH